MSIHYTADTVKESSLYREYLACIEKIKKFDNMNERIDYNEDTPLERCADNLGFKVEEEISIPDTEASTKLKDYVTQIQAILEADKRSQSRWDRVSTFFSTRQVRERQNAFSSLNECCQKFQIVAPDEDTIKALKLQFVYLVISKIVNHHDNWKNVTCQKLILILEQMTSEDAQDELRGIPLSQDKSNWDNKYNRVMKVLTTQFGETGIYWK